MRETDFTNAKVGDTIYRWEEPHGIIAVSKTGYNYPITVDGGVPAGGQTITNGGREFLEGDRCWFWLPVPEPVPPERPKRRVKKEEHGWVREHQVQSPYNPFFFRTEESAGSKFYKVYPATLTYEEEE